MAGILCLLTTTCSVLLLSIIYLAFTFVQLYKKLVTSGIIMLIFCVRRLSLQIYSSIKSVRRKFSRSHHNRFWRMVQNCGEHSLISPDIVNRRPKDLDYQEAISVLNKLQSNIDVLEKSKKFPEDAALRNIPDTIKYLARLGITLSDLDKLRSIHVSGTKGKGSTCAFSESILRHHGLKTGFFSSPHIIAVRERIRINGQPLLETVFASYFWEVYDSLYRQRISTDDMPPYFKFLTVMAYYVFLKEQVDVAVIEVGIGGQYDCTNVLRNPAVCGISSLGIDHTLILGPTLQSIAWQKAGIMKIDVPTFTTVQKEEAMLVLKERASSIGAKLMVAKPLEYHNWQGRETVLGLSGQVQEINAALALHLTNYWLTKYKYITQNEIKENRIFQDMIIEVTKSMADGLQNCQWAGRYQILKLNNIVYYLDGAHTPESIQTCVQWFNDSFRPEQKNKTIVKGLLFSITGDRTPESLLEPLLNTSFNFVCFSPTTLFDSSTTSVPADLISLSISKEVLSRRCESAEEVWVKLWTNRLNKEGCSVPNENIPQWTKIFTCISKAIAYLKTKEFIDEFKHSTQLTQSINENEIEVHLLVTGSLHLVGGVLGILDPSINNFTT